MAGARRVAVLAAMVPELKPVVRALELAPLALAGVRAYGGRAAGREIVAAVTAMGTRAARDVTARLLDAHPVEHVVVVGICGAVDRGLALGELVVPEVVLDEASGERHRPAPLEGFAARGTLLTTDVLHRDPETIERLRRAGVVALDMETAAIAATCAARDVPCSVLRAVSDRAGDPGVDEAVLGLTRPDGTANPAAIARFVVTRPWRLPELARLGAGMRLAVQTSTAALLGALSAPRGEAVSDGAGGRAS